MKPTSTLTAFSHPARKAARAALRANPSFDFSEPAEPLDTRSFEEFVAELERECPSSRAPQPAEIAQYEYSDKSYLADLLRGEAARLLTIASLHTKFVRYDKNAPEVYADECAYTVYAPYLTLLELADASPEARFVAQELFKTAGWTRPFHVRPLTDEGVDKCRSFVAQVAKRIAPFCTPGNTDLFGQ